nr:hypothetical protein [Pyrinomonadaceae bacterium]
SEQNRKESGKKRSKFFVKTVKKILLRIADELRRVVPVFGYDADELSHDVDELLHDAPEFVCDAQEFVCDAQEFVNDAQEFVNDVQEFGFVFNRFRF